jgi:tetratricopeptide (TPR) repeat protein
MKVLHRLLPVLALPLVACAGPETESAAEMEEAGAEAPDVVMVMPVSTQSEEARGHYMAGSHALDMARPTEANTLFEQAVAADPQFAAGYLMIASSAASTEEFTANLALANQYAARASQQEQLRIAIMQRGFENNTEGQLEAALELVDVEPLSPRAWLTLAGVQAGLNDVEASRTSVARAIELAPDFAAAHTQAGNSYLFLEPKDFAKAEEHFRRAIALQPTEPNPYDLLGDVHRAQGDLQAAYEDYTMAAERAPEMGSPLQQRGHVNSFLGNYDEARADYDRAMELETMRGNTNAPFYAVFRAYVSIHAGEPEAAIEELREIAVQADAMEAGGVDAKINAVTNVAQIAMHYADFETAASAFAERAALVRSRAEGVGSESFTRLTEAGIVYWEGMLAARSGDAETAQAKAQEYAALVESDPNPRKLEPVHQLLGMNDFVQGDFASAAEQLAQAAPGNVYMDYYEALALAETGAAAEAREILEALSVYNFNGVNYAMIRADVLSRVAM